MASSRPTGLFVISQTPLAQQCHFLGTFTSLTPPGKCLFFPQAFYHCALPRKPSLTTLPTDHALGSHCIPEICWTCPGLCFLASAQTPPPSRRPGNLQEGLWESACNVSHIPPGGSSPPLRPLKETWGPQGGEGRDGRADPSLGHQFPTHERDRQDGMASEGPGILKDRENREGRSTH